MLRKLAVLIAAAGPAFGQLQLMQFDGSNEAVVGTVYQTAAVAPGDSLETRFRVRNFSNGSATLMNLSVAGQAFRISASPSLPYVIASSQFTEFRVAFTPDAIGSYSATLQVNSISVIIRGSAVPAVRVSLGTTVLAAGAVINFGNTEWGTTSSQIVTLSNAASNSIMISSILISGAVFQGPPGVATPLNLAPGQSLTLPLTFAPATSGSAIGTLTIDQRTFTLAGTGFDPPFPKAAILLASDSGSSSTQSGLTIALGATPKTAATGTLTLQFHPAVPGVADDAAVQFLSGPPRAATVTFNPGDATGHFSGNTKMMYQTGTTAGTVTFTLQLLGQSPQTTVTIAPAVASFDLASGTVRTSDLDVSLTGFDNTHSASQIAFTFYNKAGQPIQTPIQVDLTKSFQNYFSTTQLGGAFALRATFPVTGDPSKIGSVDVALTNSAGVAKTQRITF